MKAKTTYIKEQTKLQFSSEKVPTIKMEEKWDMEFPQQEMNWARNYNTSLKLSNILVKYCYFNMLY